MERDSFGKSMLLVIREVGGGKGVLSLCGIELSLKVLPQLPAHSLYILGLILPISNFPAVALDVGQST